MRASTRSGEPGFVRVRRGVRSLLVTISGRYGRGGSDYAAAVVAAAMEAEILEVWKDVDGSAARWGQRREWYFRTGVSNACR